MTRGPFQGVLQILRFNKRFYAGTLVAIAMAVFAALRIPAPGNALLMAATIPPLFWMCSSLAVSHYIYDRFPLYDLRWLAVQFAKAPGRWVNINAGLDETTRLLHGQFPATEGVALDIYDATQMTERSIAEARKTGSAVSSVAADWSNLPVPSSALDAVFLIFAAHELRRTEARMKFFGELARVLRPGGETILLEHARDWRNFLAFGPGFLHFFSMRTWRETARAAGFELRQEFTLTPFVHALVLRRPV